MACTTPAGTSTLSSAAGSWRRRKQIAASQPVHRPPLADFPPCRYRCSGSFDTPDPPSPPDTTRPLHLAGNAGTAGNGKDSPRGRPNQELTREHRKPDGPSKKSGDLLSVENRVKRLGERPRTHSTTHNDQTSSASSARRQPPSWSAASASASTVTGATSRVAGAPRQRSTARLTVPADRRDAFRLRQLRRGGGQSLPLVCRLGIDQASRRLRIRSRPTASSSMIPAVPRTSPGVGGLSNAVRPMRSCIGRTAPTVHEVTIRGVRLSGSWSPDVLLP